MKIVKPIIYKDLGRSINQSKLSIRNSKSPQKLQYARESPGIADVNNFELSNPQRSLQSLHHISSKTTRKMEPVVIPRTDDWNPTNISLDNCPDDVVLKVQQLDLFDELY